MATVTPITTVQNNSITGQDAGITAGAAAVGGIAGATAGYIMKPTASQFAKRTVENTLNNINIQKGACQAFLDEYMHASAEEAAQADDIMKPILKAVKEVSKKLNLPEIVTTNPKEAMESMQEQLLDLEGKLTDGKSFKEAAKTATGEAKEALLAKAEQYKGELKKFMDTCKENYKNADDAFKNALKPEFRTGNMIKYATAGAIALGLITAGYLYYTKDNNADSQQTQTVEKA